MTLPSFHFNRYPSIRRGHQVTRMMRQDVSRTSMRLIHVFCVYEGLRKNAALSKPLPVRGRDDTEILFSTEYMCMLVKMQVRLQMYVCDTRCTCCMPTIKRIKLVFIPTRGSIEGIYLQFVTQMKRWLNLLHCATPFSTVLNVLGALVP